MGLLLAGFTWFAQFLALLLSGVALWFTQYVAKRLAVIALAVTAAAGATAVFYSALGGLASALIASAPPWFAQGCSLCVPSNLHACATAIAAAHAARLVYVWQYRIIFAKAAA